MVESNGNKTFTGTPAGLLIPNDSYKIKVRYNVLDANGIPIDRDYTQINGFITVSSSTTNGFANLVPVADVRSPGFMTIDAAGNVYAVGSDATHQRTVYVLGRDGAVQRSILVHDPGGSRLQGVLGIALDSTEQKFTISGGGSTNLFFEFDLSSGSLVRSFGSRLPYVIPSQYSNLPNLGFLGDIVRINDELFGVTAKTAGGFYEVPSAFEGFRYSDGAFLLRHNPLDFTQLSAATAVGSQIAVSRGDRAGIVFFDRSGNVASEFTHPTSTFYSMVGGLTYDQSRNRMLGTALRVYNGMMVSEIFVIDPVSGEYKHGAKLTNLGFPSDTFPFDLQALSGNPPAIFLSAWNGKIYRLDYRP